MVKILLARKLFFKFPCFFALSLVNYLLKQLVLLKQGFKLIAFKLFFCLGSGRFVRLAFVSPHQPRIYQYSSFP
jgi:phosphoglycerol transferase MdoB-like AlkP superfamily enzyme